MWCSFKNGYLNEICLSKEIGLRAQDMSIILNSRVNMNAREDLHDYSMSTRIFTLTMKKDVLMSSENHDSERGDIASLGLDLLPSRTANNQKFHIRGEMG